MISQGLKIKDGTEERNGQGGLRFDLAEIIQALGGRALASSWHCKDLNYVSDDDTEVEVMEELGTKQSGVAGDALVAGISRLLQVIDGEFSVRDLNGHCWAVVRAVDSSWWEVWSDEQAVLAGLESYFNVTERIVSHAG